MREGPSMYFPGTDDLCGDYCHGLDIVSPGSSLLICKLLYFSEQLNLHTRPQSRNRIFVELSNGIDVNKNQILKFRPSFIPAI
ncbi:hypothetical protein YC2023_054364 [Brassica napus]